MTLGIDETPMIRSVNGTQNHTVAIAPPVIIDAVGTTPMGRRGDAAGASTASGLVSVTATTP